MALIYLCKVRPHLIFPCCPEKINELRAKTLKTGLARSALNNPLFACKADSKPDSSEENEDGHE
jgi:hypothetical protein